MPTRISQIKPPEIRGPESEEKLNNARYTISMARKIRTRVYVLPEDLNEAKPKMVLLVLFFVMGKGMNKV